MNASRIPKGPPGLRVGMLMGGAVESDPGSKQSPETSSPPEKKISAAQVAVAESEREARSATGPLFLLHSLLISHFRI